MSAIYSSHPVKIDMAVSENVDHRIERPDSMVRRESAGHRLQLFGNFHFEYDKHLMTLATKLLRPCNIRIINDKMFDFGKYLQEESNDFEIDQSAPDQPYTIRFSGKRRNVE